MSLVRLWREFLKCKYGFNLHRQNVDVSMELNPPWYVFPLHPISFDPLLPFRRILLASWVAFCCPIWNSETVFRCQQTWHVNHILRPWMFMNTLHPCWSSFPTWRRPCRWKHFRFILTHDLFGLIIVNCPIFLARSFHPLWISRSYHPQKSVPGDTLVF